MATYQYKLDQFSEGDLALDDSSRSSSFMALPPPIHERIEERGATRRIQDRVPELYGSFPV